MRKEEKKRAAQAHRSARCTYIFLLFSSAVVVLFIWFVCYWCHVKAIHASWLLIGQFHMHVVQWIKSGIRSATSSIKRAAWLCLFFSSSFFCLLFHFYWDYFVVFQYFRGFVLKSQRQNSKLHLIISLNIQYSSPSNHHFITTGMNGSPLTHGKKVSSFFMCPPLIEDNILNNC